MNEEIICYCNLLEGKLKRKKNNNTWKEEEGNYGKMEERSSLRQKSGPRLGRKDTRLIKSFYHGSSSI